MLDHLELCDNGLNDMCKVNNSSRPIFLRYRLLENTIGIILS